MSDYIKREDAINELCNNCTVGIIEYGECRYMFNGECKEARGIKDLPSADVVERQKYEQIKGLYEQSLIDRESMAKELEATERKRGEWIDSTADTWTPSCRCSNCRMVIHECSAENAQSNYLGNLNFCPNCGADMRADRKE